MSKCKDCDENSKRPAPHPGPRCFSHHKEKLKRDEDRARDQKYRKLYGITLDDYNRLYAFQGGKCYVCRWATGKTKYLAVDHDHETGEVRGLLCSRDNRMIGYARDNPEYFERTAEYLRNPPYKRMREQDAGK